MSPDAVIAKRPIDTPLIVAVGGPRALANADAIADGIMCAGVISPGVRDAYLLSFGTVLREGETLTSPRVLDAIGPAIAVIYHGSYQAGGAARSTRSRAAQRAVRRSSASPKPCATSTCTRATYTSSPSHIAPALAAATFTGTPEQLRERSAAHEAQGIAEIVYAPIGPDVAGELRAMRAALAD